MTPADYPALWRSSTAAAAACQRWFLIWVRSHLIFLGVTAFASAWTPTCISTQRELAGLIAIVMFLALIVGLIARHGRLDDSWFRARALAENSKGAAWRFMMKPRPTSQDDNDAEEDRFLGELSEYRGRLPQVEKHLSKHDDGGEEITVKMRELRAMPYEFRLNFYIDYRLNDQIDWYRGKAKWNAQAESRWVVGILVFESVAVIIAVSRMFALHEFNPTGAVASIAACLFAWTQTKRYSDLANTYGVAGRDLNGLRTKADHVRDESQFQQLVAEVEASVSREHRLWIEHRSMN
jgi:hypothetical protein